MTVCLSTSSFPNKQKSHEAPSAMNSTAGSNLTELDRLLLELNAVQQSTPCFPTTGMAAGARGPKTLTGMLCFHVIIVTLRLFVHDSIIKIA